MAEIIDYCRSASEVRKEWSRTIDTVIRERPVFVQRTRDNLVMLDLATFRLLFEQFRFDVSVYREDDGTVTCTEDHLDLAENDVSVGLTLVILGEVHQHGVPPQLEIIAQ